VSVPAPTFPRLARVVGASLNTHLLQLADLTSQKTASGSLLSADRARRRPAASPISWKFTWKVRLGFPLGFPLEFRWSLRARAHYSQRTSGRTAGVPSGRTRLQTASLAGLLEPVERIISEALDATQG